MRSTILTILPHPSERLPGTRPALTAASCAESTETREAATRGSAETLPSIESLLLQRLLAEVEARQLARAQPTYVIEQSPAPRHTILIRTLWSLLWLLSMILCVFVVKYIDSQTMPPHADAGQARAIEGLTASIGDQKKDFSTMIDSLNGLASAIAANSTHSAAIPALLSRLNNDLQQLRAPPARKPIDLGTSPASPTHDADFGPISMGGHHHSPIEAATVAPQGAVVHYNALGVMDYWLVPRVLAGLRTMAKVVPISQTTAGSLVHHVAEVKDYILTPSGDWIAVPEGDGNQ
jgi:hypothetical protein